MLQSDFLLPKLWGRPLKSACSALRAPKASREAESLSCRKAVRKVVRKVVRIMV